MSSASEILGWLAVNRLEQPMSLDLQTIPQPTHPALEPDVRRGRFYSAAALCRIWRSAGLRPDRAEVRQLCVRDMPASYWGRVAGGGPFPGNIFPPDAPAARGAAKPRRLAASHRHSFGAGFASQRIVAPATRDRLQPRMRSRGFQLGRAFSLGRSGAVRHARGIYGRCSSSISCSANHRRSLAAELGQSPSTMSRRMHGALAELRQHLRLKGVYALPAALAALLCHVAARRRRRVSCAELGKMSMISGATAAARTAQFGSPDPLRHPPSPKLMSRMVSPPMVLALIGMIGALILLQLIGGLWGSGAAHPAEPEQQPNLKSKPATAMVVYAPVRSSQGSLQKALAP